MVMLAISGASKRASGETSALLALLPLGASAFQRGEKADRRHDDGKDDGGGDLFPRDGGELDCDFGVFGHDSLSTASVSRSGMSLGT